jgi:hypothetical protein
MTKIFIELPEIETRYLGDDSKYPYDWPEQCPHCESKGTQLSGYSCNTFEYECGGCYERGCPSIPCGNPSHSAVLMALSQRIEEELDAEGVPANESHEEI